MLLIEANELVHIYCKEELNQSELISELNSIKLVEDSILSQRLKYITNTLFEGYDKDDFYPFKFVKHKKDIIDYIIEVKNIDLIALNKKTYEIETKAMKIRDKYSLQILPRIQVYKKPPYVIVEFTLAKP